MPFSVEADWKLNSTLLSSKSQYFKMCPKFISDSYSLLINVMFISTVHKLRESTLHFSRHALSTKPERNLEFSVSPLWILFNQSHHVDEVTDANTHEQPQGRLHCMTPHLPSPEPALTASCFVCLVKVPLHILRQGHALPVSCLSCSSLAIHLLYPGIEPLAHIPNKFLVCTGEKERKIAPIGAPWSLFQKQWEVLFMRAYHWTQIKEA